MNCSDTGSSHPLVLGTAQLGSAYGIANRTGKPDQDLATSIIREAWENGIREFDTAQAYGMSEEVLGRALTELGLSTKVRIISKFEPGIDHLDHALMSSALDKSLYRIDVPSLFGMMLHSEEKLSLWDKGLKDIVCGFIESGLVKYIGVSVYSPEKAIQALNTEGIDMVQIPTSILDHRFEQAGVFDIAEEKKKTIYIRSIFLQGLIFMDADDVPENMLFADEVIERLSVLSKKTGLTRLEIALGYLKAALPNAQIVFGADTPPHVKENCTSWNKNISLPVIHEIKKTFDNVDEKILNPSLWNN